MKSIFKLLGVVVGVAVGGYLVSKAVSSKKKDAESTEHTDEPKEEKKQKKEKSEIHPKVRVQIAMARAAADIAEFILRHKKEIEALTKVASLGAAILSFVHAGKKLMTDRKIGQTLTDIQGDLNTLKNRDNPRDSYLKGWRASTKDVLDKMKLASEKDWKLGMVDNPDGDFYFKVKMVDY